MSTDAALQALYSEMAKLASPLWWFAGEQADAPPAARDGWQAFTNRCDIARDLRASGYKVGLGDFELPEFELPESAPVSICYRVSKEKPLVHFLINEAARRLPVGGCLVLSGYKGDGIKTYADKAAKLLGSVKNIDKRHSGVYVALIVKAAEPSELLPDQDYRQLRPIFDEPLLYSKPGVFGWQKRDRGSALLIEQLPKFLTTLDRTPERIADLGCGYGYLPVMAQSCVPGASWLLTDNNATALLACEKNCELHGLQAELHLADCGEGLDQQVDVVLCNPPFHQGFAVDGELTDRFVAAAHRLLRPGGQALFVVNQFIPLQHKAEKIFAGSELMLREDGFCVIRLRKA